MSTRPTSKPPRKSGAATASQRAPKRPANRLASPCKAIRAALRDLQQDVRVEHDKPGHAYITFGVDLYKPGKYRGFIASGCVSIDGSGLSTDPVRLFFQGRGEFFVATCAAKELSTLTTWIASAALAWAKGPMRPAHALLFASGEPGHNEHCAPPLTTLAARAPRGPAVRAPATPGDA